MKSLYPETDTIPQVQTNLRQGLGVDRVTQGQVRPSPGEERPKTETMTYTDVTPRSKPISRKKKKITYCSSRRVLQSAATMTLSSVHGGIYRAGWKGLGKRYKCLEQPLAHRSHILEVS